MKTYSEKLKDPRWQKKRLEVMEDREFLCESCFNGKSTLHVHHKEYFSGRNPWEYSKEQLAVLCESCHENFHSETDILKLVCSYARMDGPVNREELAFLIAGYMGNTEYGRLNIEYSDLIKMSGIYDMPNSPNKAYFDAGVQAAKIASKLTKEYYKKRQKRNAD